jgi:hypothetical protein
MPDLQIDGVPFLGVLASGREYFDSSFKYVTTAYVKVLKYAEFLIIFPSEPLHFQRHSEIIK